MSDEIVIRMQAVDAGYAGVPVLYGIDLEVRAGEVVTLLGANGAGKTTTLKTIAGMIRPLSGSVTVLGAPVGRHAPERIASRGLAHVTDARNLFPRLTVEENLRLGLPAGRRARRTGMTSVYELFPALAPLRKRHAGLLSGGEQQMLAMGRAIGSHPKVLLLDELSLGLAPVIVERLLPVVQRVASDTGCAVLMVEQHVQMALEVATRGYVLQSGHITNSGSALELAARRDILEASYLGESAVATEAESR